MIARLIKIDFHMGAVGAGPVILGVVLASLAGLLDVYGTIAAFGLPCDQMSFADNFAAIMAGSPPHSPRPGVLFLPPLQWMLLLILMHYLTLSYPYRDISGIGQQMLLRCRSRRDWWISKCLWTIGMTLIAFAAIVLTAGLWAFAFGQSFSVEIHEEMLSYIGVSGDLIRQPKTFGLGFILAVPAVLAGMALLQMVLSVLVRPSVSFVLTLIALIASSYTQSPLLLGNYLMAVRCGDMAAGGVSPLTGAALGLALCLVSAFIGYHLLSHLDLIDREWSA